MTIPFVPQGTKRHETVLLALGFAFLYNIFEEQINYRARGGECATKLADRIIMCANHHFKHK